MIFYTSGERLFRFGLDTYLPTQVYCHNPRGCSAFETLNQRDTKEARFPECSRVKVALEPDVTLTKKEKGK